MLPAGTKPRTSYHRSPGGERREAWKEEVLDDLHRKDERRPSSIRWTLEPFKRQCRVNFWETGWSAYGLFWAHRYHLELNWNIHQLTLYYYLSFVVLLRTWPFWGATILLCFSPIKKQSWPNTNTHFITCITHAGLFSHDVTQIHTSSLASHMLVCSQSWPNTNTHFITCITHAGLFTVMM